MKLLLSIFLFSISLSTPEWLTDFNKARQQAAESNKMILLNFSGSDWCIPCIRMKTDFFNVDAFREFAVAHLVLASADFPRLKKNQLTKELVKQNEALADKYNKDGKFPFTALLDSKGKVLKVWDGFPEESPAKF